MKSSNILEEFLPLWIDSQYKLHKVIRWSNRINDGIGKKMILQSTLQHTISFVLFSTTSVMRLQPHIQEALGKKLDASLLKTTFETHDLGEMLTKEGDVSGPNKTYLDDLNEYLKVKELFSSMPVYVASELEYSFLVQFALSLPECFPHKAREIMSKIQKNHYYEALTFQALEKFEYLFYPLWMWKEKRHPYLLTWLIRLYLLRYREFAEKLPGFRQEIFTYSLEEWMLDFLKEHENVPEENGKIVKIVA